MEKHEEDKAYCVYLRAYSMAIRGQIGPGENSVFYYAAEAIASYDAACELSHPQSKTAVMKAILGLLK
jgi:hypothetical protein